MATVIVATQGWRMTRHLLSPQHIFLKNTCSTKFWILGKLSTFPFLSNLLSRVFILLSAGWFAWLGLIWSVFPSTSFCHVRLLANKGDKKCQKYHCIWYLVQFGHIVWNGVHSSNYFPFGWTWMLGLVLWGAVYYPVDISPNSKLHGSNTLCSA